MISRTNRFHGRGSLGRHYKQSKSVRSTVMSLRYIASRSAHYRLAVVVSRKVSKSAVVRNRIRRRVYEHVRILSNDFNAPFDLVIIVYDERVAKLPTEQLRYDLKKMCQKAGMVPMQTSLHAIVESKE